MSKSGKHYMPKSDKRSHCIKIDLAIGSSGKLDVLSRC